MPSKRISQIVDVANIVNDEIKHLFDNNESYEGITDEELEKIISEAIKTVAKQYDVDDSTVSSKCTREIKVDMKGFVNLIKDYLTGGSKLKDAMRKHSPKDEDRKLINNL